MVGENIKEVSGTKASSEHESPEFLSLLKVYLRHIKKLLCSALFLRCFS